MKKKLSLIITLALSAFITTGCDALDNFFGGKEKTPNNEPEQQESQDQSGDNQQPEQPEQPDNPVNPSQTCFYVNYDSNGGAGSMHRDRISSSEYVTRGCDFTYEGHSFSKWALNSVTGQQYDEGEKISGITGDITLYALWTDNTSQVNYNVSFNPNGGSGTMADQKTNGATYSVPVCSFTREEYKFKEWALDSESGTKYSVGSTITDIDADFTLYAIWEKVVALGDFNGYYDGISDSLTGTSLLNALHSLNSTKRKKTVGYGGMRQFAALSDADPDGSGKIIGFYDNKKVGPSWDSGSTWNREHVWPDVRDGDKVEDDAHMVRPASTSTNSGRGSKGFGSDSYDPGEDVAYYRGAAARIIFYAAIADTSLEVVDYSFPYDGVGSGNHGYAVGTMGSLSEMLEWNLQYLPSDKTFTGDNDLARRTELNRNEVIQNHSDGQGNRNPFIDHPEYACKIWGNTNSKTKSICGM